MVGRTLGHYRIQEKIGAGGMGEVYRARDEQLARDVAIKVLPASSFSDPGARARLLREARSAASLNHPHICTIYEVGEAEGQAYIAMEFVEGQPLSARLAGGALPTEQVLRYGLQLAEALGHAHEHGVVHRDLKSANVVITAEGRAKVLDFGLAKRLSEGEMDEVTRSQASLTTPGALVGTLAYMAPEQFRGQPADARSDVWALGVVIYEMATGVRPFQGQTGFELSSAILSHRSEPLPGKVPVELRAVIERCLEKEPGRRYHQGGAVRAALEAIQAGAVAPWTAWRYRLARRRWLAVAGTVVLLAAALVGLNVGRLRERIAGRAGPPRIDSIAVLPLENLSGDPEQEYFADGMTEALITDLAKIGALRVISRTSMMQYKGIKKPLPQIGRELGVDAVVEGSVLRSGERVRITAQLIRTDSDKHLWAESYERDLRDVLALQNEVAQAIAREIHITLSPDEQTRTSQARPVNPEAYELYLKGRYHFYQRNLGQQELRTARDYFEQALQKDPSYAPAYSGLADAYNVLAFRGAIPRAEGLARDRAAATKALELDESLAEAHASLAAVQGEADLDWAGSEREMKRAIELNPNYAQAHSWYAKSLSNLARHDEAIAEARRAVQLDPLARPFTNALQDVLFFARRYDEVIALCRKMIELDPKDADPYYMLANAYQLKGAHKQAFEAYKKFISLVEPDAAKWADGMGFSLSEPDAKKYVAGLKQAYFQGDMDAANRFVKGEIERQPKSFPPYLKAIVYARLGEKERALAWLEKIVAERGPGAFELKVEPDWDPLRSDPRFQALLRRMNFPP